MVDSNKDKIDKLPDKFDVDLTPFKNFMQQMDSFFQQSFNQMNSFLNLRPFKTHVYETTSDIIVEAELPHYKREQIHIEVIGKRLRIAVEEQAITEEKDDINHYYRKSQSQQYLERFVTLPFEIPEHETKATFNKGLLKITIPKNNSNTTYLNID